MAREHVDEFTLKYVDVCIAPDLASGVQWLLHYCGRNLE